MALRVENQAEPIPGYRLIERIGGGGFGEVWKCEAPGGLHKAIKFVFGDLGAAGEDGHRAEQELKALSRVKTVRHPYILSLERYDIIDGQLLIVMELADRNLWDRFRECRAQGLPGIPHPELLAYMEETAEALDLMNSEYQLQHLDIKPQNLFLVHNHVKVADFGLVKDLEGMQASVTGGVTPVYASPETFDGWVSRFCDQYSLAIVYQELLTGQRPFSGNNVRQLILQHLQSPPNLSPLSAADQPIIGRALSKTPGDRFPTCREMVEALRRNAGRSEGSFSPAGGAKSRPDSVLDSQPIAPSARSGLSGSLGLALDLEETGLSTGDEPATASIRSRPDSNPGTTHSLRALEGAVLKTEGGEETFEAPPEINGNGILFPALVIGLGHLGMTVVQRLREHLHTQFGSLEQLPHVHLLVLDTDPDIVRAATRGPQGARLSETDIVLAPLNRPSHYIKPRDGRPDLDKWLHPRLLYRIPRSQVTTGVRALGRLAFLDNYRAIVRRLQTELHACLEPGALAGAVQQTQLGLRTNRPRIYIITSLAGGTGSGIFLDLAYTMRALLKQAGYNQPDVVGLFLLPSVDRNRTRTLTLGNACAALRELTYFARPGTTFTAQYHKREAPIQDSEPPFSRSILLPLPEETDEIGTRKLIEQAGLFLSRDLCSPLGRVADLARAGQSAPPWASRGLFYQTFGLCTLSWPRRTLLRTVARRLCSRLVQRWMSKDSKPIRESVHSWVQEQWTKQELGSSVLMERLGDACHQALGQPPEEIFQGLVAPLIPPERAPRNGRKGPAPEVELPLEQIADILEEFEQLLGKPEDDGLAENNGRLAVLLREAADKLVQHWGQKLAELPVHLIESPEFRLAGAEEVIRQLIASIEQALQHHEPLSKELTTRAVETYHRLNHLVAPLRAGRNGTAVRKVIPAAARRAPLTAAEVFDWLRTYPKTHYQTLLLRQAGNIFLTLRGHLADEMREVNFCRVRLGELQRMLEEPAVSEAISADNLPGAAGPGLENAIGRHLYPAGCLDLRSAVEQVLSRISPAALLDLDGRMQAMLHKQFTALAHVCLTSANILKSVDLAMLQTAETFVAEQLGEVDVAEMFFTHSPTAEKAEQELTCLFNEANPVLPPEHTERGPEVCVLAAPSSPAGDQLRGLAQQTSPEAEWQSAPGSEDILLYRELCNLPLSELHQVGPAAQDAYRQLTAAEHFTPHCRTDVDF
jgi:serine/threonine protein kinase